MEINGQECRVLNVRTDKGEIVHFYCPNDWQANDVTGIVCRPQYDGANTKNYTGFVVWGNVHFPVCGTQDNQGQKFFYLMPDKAERHYDSQTTYITEKKIVGENLA